MLQGRSLWAEPQTPSFHSRARPSKEIRRRQLLRLQPAICPERLERWSESELPPTTLERSQECPKKLKPRPEGAHPCCWKPNAGAQRRALLGLTQKWT